jgi:Transposase
MQVLHQCCCGLDVHKRFVVACLIRQTEEGKPHKELRRYETLTPELLRLVDWLQSAGCTHVALESTGVYWKPIFACVGGAVRDRARQCAAYESGTGSQNRHEGCGMDRGSLTARLTQSVLHSTAAPARPARFDALPEPPQTGANAPCQSRAQVVGGNQHQAQFGLC